MKDTLKKYKRQMWWWGFLRNALRFVGVILCFAGVFAIICLLLGVFKKIEVEGITLTMKLFLYLLIAVFVVIPVYLIQKMVVTSTRCRKALARLDLLIIRLELQLDNELTTTQIDRELQLVARIFESQPFF